jgi:cytochrome c oxidase cbb3-type subunit 4
MDINDLRSGVTLVSLLLFLLLVLWVWMPRRRNGFRRAAELPFEGEEPGHE